MANFINQHCSICGKHFTKQDDIVVCPICGTPQHRLCFNELGHCINETLHGDNFEYSTEESSVAPVLCGKCNAANSGETGFCDRCGFPLKAGVVPEKISGAKSFINTISTIELFEQAVHPNTEEELDGIKLKDWYTYIGSSAPRYIYSFKKMDRTGQKVSFCLPALLFPPYFFLFRKMWFVGIIAVIIDMFLSIPASLLLINQYFNITLPYSVEILTSASDITQIVLFGINALWGIFAIHLYRGSARRRINLLRERSKTIEEYEIALNKTAGPSQIILYAVIALMVFTLFSRF